MLHVEPRPSDFGGTKGTLIMKTPQLDADSSARRCSAFPPAFVLVGRKSRHLAIPAGYALIETGEAQDGDLFANLMTSQWSPVDRADIGDGAINFDYLIRRQNPTVEPRAADLP